QPRATPVTSSPGAWSPPIASTAIDRTLRGLPRETGAERRRLDAVLERPAAVHAQHRHLHAVGRGERGVPVDVDVLELDRDLARDAVDDRAHLLAQVAVGPAVEGEPDHRIPRLVDTLRHLKYR